MGKSFNSIHKRQLDDPEFLFGEGGPRAVVHYDEHPDNHNCLARRVTNHLYECVSGDNYCRFLVTFGYGKYCSRLMTDRTGWVGRIIPRYSEIERELFD
jgi:hypothetical protein